MEIRYKNSLLDLFIGSARSQFRSPLIWLVFAATFLFFRIFPLLKAPEFNIIMLPLAISFSFIGQAFLWLIIILIVSALSALLQFFGPNREGVIGEHVITFSDTSFTEQTKFNKTEHQWNSIFRISENWLHIYIYLDRSRYYVIPKKIFPDKAALSSFLTFMQSNISKVKSLCMPSP